MTLCTGRLPKDEAYCAALPQLSNYTLPDPVSQWSCTDLVAQALNENSISALYPIDFNDSVGDCTTAGVAHLITLQNGMIGSRIVPSANDVLKLYGDLGGRGMSGLNLTTVLNAWLSGILGGQKIIADCNVDASNLKAVKQTIQYLNGAYIGFETTSDTVPQFQAKQPWTVTNGRRQGGHCVVATGWDDATGMFSLLSWGGLQLATYEWWLKYVDEVHGAVSSTVAAALDPETVALMQQAMPALA